MSWVEAGEFSAVGQGGDSLEPERSDDRSKFMSDTLMSISKYPDWSDELKLSRDEMPSKGGAEGVWNSCQGNPRGCAWALTCVYPLGFVDDCKELNGFCCGCSPRGVLIPESRRGVFDFTWNADASPLWSIGVGYWLPFD